MMLAFKCSAKFHAQTTFTPHPHPRERVKSVASCFREAKLSAQDKTATWWQLAGVQTQTHLTPGPPLTIMASNLKGHLFTLTSSHLLKWEVSQTRSHLEGKLVARSQAETAPEAPGTYNWSSAGQPALSQRGCCQDSCKPGLWARILVGLVVIEPRSQAHS